MKPLLDANLSPRLAESLTTTGYAVVHVADLGLTTASDSTIFDGRRRRPCRRQADSDFPVLLALRRASSPSVVHLRDVAELAPAEHAALLVADLPLVTPDLERGAFVPEPDSPRRPPPSNPLIADHAPPDELAIRLAIYSRHRGTTGDLSANTPPNVGW